MRRQSERDESFSAFMRGAQPSLLRTAYFLTGSDDLARELVQDALVRAYLVWPKIRDGAALAYTRRILVNRRIDHARRARREVPTASDPDTQVEADHSHIEREWIVALLARLPEQQRKVIVLRYACDMSEKETAAVLGLSVGGVKSAASRGMAALRSMSDFEESHEH